MLPPWCAAYLAPAVRIACPAVSVFVLAVAIFLLSFTGGIAPRWLASSWTDERLQDITGVASGLLLASALLVVIPEGFDVAVASSDATSTFTDEPVWLGAAVLAGFVVMLLLEGSGIGHAVHEEHHDHAEGHGHGHVHHPKSSVALAFGLSVHAAADGLAIGAAAVAGDTAFSVLVALAVLLHRVPAAFSLGLFSLHETRNPRRAAGGILAFSVATPITMVGSYLLLDGSSQRFIALSLLFSAGTFVYVATVDTLPAVHNTETGRRSVVMVLIGAAVFAVVFLGLDTAGLLEHDAHG